MRWGVSEIAGDDHKTSTLCVDQIRTCQEISAGPNFVVGLENKSIVNYVLNRINYH